MAVITKEEFEEWIKHPVTERLMGKIKSDVEYMKNILIEAGFSDIKEIQGRIKASQRLLEITYEDMYNE